MALHRFDLSHRDVEDLMAERRINVSYEPINDTSQYANNRAELSHEEVQIDEAGTALFLDLGS